MADGGFVDVVNTVSRLVQAETKYRRNESFFEQPLFPSLHVLAYAERQKVRLWNLATKKEDELQRNAQQEFFRCHPVKRPHRFLAQVSADVTARE